MFRGERRTQAQRRAETEARLVEAAIQTLADAGYAGTSLGVVAERAGLTTGAVQRRFGTKAALLAAVYDELVERGLNSLEVLAQSSGTDPAERLVRGVWATLDGPVFEASLELERAARGDDELRTAIFRSRRAASERVAANLAQAFGSDVKDEHFRAATTTVVLALRGLAATRSLLPASEIDQALGRIIELARSSAVERSAT